MARDAIQEVPSALKLTFHFILCAALSRVLAHLRISHQNFSRHLLPLCNAFFYLHA